MNHLITIEQIISKDILPGEAVQLTTQINRILTSLSAEQAWKKISKEILTTKHSFALHSFIFKTIYPDWPEKLDSAPAWIPDEKVIKSTNLYQFMSEMNVTQFDEFHAWTIDHYQAFWKKMIAKLNIIFNRSPENICNVSRGIETPEWLEGASFNIVDSCFNAPSNKPAIIYQNDQNKLVTVSYAELNQLSNQIANSLIKWGFKKNDAIAMDMPMHYYAVAIYIGIIKIGAIVVSIADSFSAEEIAIRIKITHTKAIFTQDVIKRDAKILPLYEKIKAANAPIAIVLPCNHSINISLRPNDLDWQTFLISNTQFNSVSCSPMDHCNILFSSGTTGEPKAIPWTHTTPIKAATDAYLHQNIQHDDIIAWPTNLGWMMGPWLVLAGFINQATIALYTDSPQTKAFGEFVQNAQVTILGVFPSLVASWRQNHCMSGLCWNAIKLFTSTGECSSPEDMLYLMSLAGYKPIIEYCGGTEIGGAFISSVLCKNNYVSVFNTPAMGLEFILIDNTGRPTTNGEVALMPPSIGLSTTILNANHHDIYYANMPTSPEGKILRRHGDQFQQLEGGLYSALGRIDDTMNIGGIKISSAEIERTLAGIPNIIESAAIAVTKKTHGPSSLVIFSAVGKQTQLSKTLIKQEMQSRITQHLNPLFKIDDLVFVCELPKTSSNKIMRRTLRKLYPVGP
jgi:acetyl-CoA synthetase